MTTRAPVLKQHVFDVQIPTVKTYYKLSKSLKKRQELEEIKSFDIDLKPAFTHITVETLLSHTSLMEYLIEMGLDEVELKRLKRVDLKKK